MTAAATEAPHTNRAWCPLRLPVPVVKAPLHAAGTEPRLTALLLRQILPVLSLGAPRQSGPLPVSVRRGFLCQLLNPSFSADAFLVC